MSEESREPTAAEKAVGRFEEASSELSTFMEEQYEFVDELRRLVDNHNAAIAEASVAVKNDLKNSDRDKLVIGRFGATKKRKEFWDGMELAALLPGKVSQHFLKERLSYEVNVSKLEQMIRQGEVDRDEAYKAFHQNAPTLSMMPGAPKELKI
jgi:NurA-like 5'-3' nuclease